MRRERNGATQDTMIRRRTENHTHVLTHSNNTSAQHPRRTHKPHTHTHTHAHTRTHPRTHTHTQATHTHTHTHLGAGSSVLSPMYRPGVGVWARLVTEKSTRMGRPSRCMPFIASRARVASRTVAKYANANPRDRPVCGRGKKESAQNETLSGDVHNPHSTYGRKREPSRPASLWGGRRYKRGAQTETLSAMPTNNTARTYAHASPRDRPVCGGRR